MRLPRASATWPPIPRTLVVLRSSWYLLAASRSPQRDRGAPAHPERIAGRTSEWVSTAFTRVHGHRTRHTRTGHVFDERRRVIEALQGRVHEARVAKVGQATDARLAARAAVAVVPAAARGIKCQGSAGVAAAGAIQRAAKDVALARELGRHVAGGRIAGVRCRLWRQMRAPQQALPHRPRHTHTAPRRPGRQAGLARFPTHPSSARVRKHRP